MPRSRRHPIVGATRLEESLPPTVLPELQKIRPAVVPVPAGPVAVGHRVHDTRRGRRPGRPAFRPRRPLHRGPLRGMALLLDHPPRPDRYAHHRDRDAEHRHGEHRQKLQHRRLQLAENRSSHYPHESRFGFGSERLEEIEDHGAETRPNTVADRGVCHSHTHQVSS